MMNSTLKSQCKVNPGTVIKGKWHNNHYQILKEIGLGANGIVYLALFKSQKVALKMSDNGMSVTSEVNVLKSFAKVQGSALGPSLIDVDDWVQGNQTVSFYVMEYIKGPDLLTFIKTKGTSWVEVLMLQLLNDLHSLHEKGWVFGDLKPENLIVSGPPPQIRCIDVGGTTIQGRAIKEFTEFYDRGYWGLGTRKSEPTYDLFAVGMIMIQLAYQKRFNKTTGGLKQLQDMIKKNGTLHKYEDVLLHSLQGNYQTALEMREALLQKVNSVPQKKTPKAGPTFQQKKPSKRRGGWVETFLIFTVISFLYLIYIYGQIF